MTTRSVSAGTWTVNILAKGITLDVVNLLCVFLSKGKMDCSWPSCSPTRVTSSSFHPARQLEHNGKGNYASRFWVSRCRSAAF